MMDLVEKIQKYEEGNMPPKEMIIFFQELVDSGLAWNLQGHYGRMAELLIEHGDVEPPKSN
jgi:hypothetical protein